MVVQALAHGLKPGFMSIRKVVIATGEVTTLAGSARGGRPIMLQYRV